jgi:oligosaccharide repeat unit polymerase
LAALLSGVAEGGTLGRSIGICSGIGTLVLILAIRALGFGWFSAPVVYLSYLWLFHFPLVLFGSLNPATLQNLPPEIYQWTLAPTWHRAALIALACVAAFTAGVSFFSGRLGSRPQTERWNDYALLAWLGGVEALFGAGLLAVSIVRGGGVQVFQTAYVELYESVFSGTYPYGVLLFTIGVSTALMGVKNRYLWVPIAAQVLYACVMLLLGARSAALLGMVIAVISLSKRGVKIPRSVAIISAVGVLWLIAVVGVARQGGVSDNFASASSADPIDALLEMGGSLRTVDVFDEWTLAGDDFQLGAGYWLPFERGIGFVIPSLRSELVGDPRAASEVLLSRRGGMGGSVVAEAYYNFGLLAPLLVFVPLGWLMAWLDRNARTPISAAWLVVVLYPLLLEVRNWFISVPAMLAVGAVPLVLLTLHRRRRKAAQDSESEVRPEYQSC